LESLMEIIMPEKKLSRRDAMKLLGAAIGGAALANLPSKWNTPEMTSGVLPAHARQSAHVVRSIAAGPDDPTLHGDLACNAQDSDITSTVSVTPPAGGIVLRYVITLTGSAVLDGTPSSDTVTTAPDGTASLSVLAHDPSGGGSLTVTWSFNDPADGSGSSSQTFNNLGC
jgi:hypothetical protein